MRSPHTGQLVRLVSLGALVLSAACAAPPAAPIAPRAAAALESASEDYAALQSIAEAVTDTGATVPGEEAQSAARFLADRIARLRGEFETLTVAMSTAELERTQSLWMRLALSHAALEQLYGAALSLSADPAASADEVRDLAAQLAGALELARACSRMAADQLQPAPPARSVAALRS
jgi:hypothetical protein